MEELSNLPMVSQLVITGSELSRRQLVSETTTAKGGLWEETVGGIQLLREVPADHQQANEDLSQP